MRCLQPWQKESAFQMQSVFLYGLWCLSPSGKASGCDSDMRGFDPHQTPQIKDCL